MPPTAARLVRGMKGCYRKLKETTRKVDVTLRSSHLKKFLNRLKTVVEKNASGVTLFSDSYILNPDGTRASDSETELQPSGSTETINITWSYDALDRLLSEAVINSDSTQSYSDVYTYNLVGNRLTKTHTGPGGGASETITYLYNPRNQLSSQASSLSGTTTGSRHEK